MPAHGSSAPGSPEVPPLEEPGSSCGFPAALPAAVPEPPGCPAAPGPPPAPGPAPGPCFSLPPASRSPAARSCCQVLPYLRARRGRAAGRAPPAPLIAAGCRPAGLRFQEAAAPERCWLAAGCRSPRPARCLPSSLPPTPLILAGGLGKCSEAPAHAELAVTARTLCY